MEYLKNVLHFQLALMNSVSEGTHQWGGYIFSSDHGSFT